MADVISRFKLETAQYDSKLRDIAKGLKDFVKETNDGGKGLDNFSKEAIEAARALGTTASGATNARDRVRDLVGAYNDAVRQFDKLSEAQQQGDFGKSLADSLERLKVRISEAKKELYGMGDAMNKAGDGGLFSRMGDKMSGALQVFAGNMLTKAAGAVANLGAEMADMVQQGIELAKQGEGIRIAFECLGRGDLLDGLRQATHGTVTDIELMKAAVKFNDFKLPLDELGTMLAFAQRKAQETGQSVDYMTESIVTGLGRKSVMILDNLGLSASEIKEKMAETGDMTKAVGAIIREQMSKAGDYVETAADRAAQANVSLQNKMEELGRKFAPLEEASNSLWTSMKIGILDVVGGPLARLLNGLTVAGRMMNAYGVMGGSGKVGRMTANLANASEGNRQSIYQQQQENFWRYINPREQQIRDIRAWQSGQRGEALQGRIGAIRDKYGSLDATKIQAEVDAAKKMLADYQQAAKQILQPIKQEITPTITTSGGATGGGGGGGSRRGGFDLSKIAFDPDKAALSAVKGADAGPSEIWKAITEGAKESTSSVEDLAKAFEKLNAVQGVTAGEAVKDSSEMAKKWSNAGTAISAVGSAMSQIEDPAAKVVGTIAQAIATIALGYAQATTSAAKLGPWAWIAFAATGLATMISTISSIHSATGYANGGIVDGRGGGFVGGSSFSGDNIGNVRLNSGELVLNKSQQNNLANALEGGGLQGMNLSAQVSGEQILLVANRTLRRKGKGELVTWK